MSGLLLPLFTILGVSLLVRAQKRREIQQSGDNILLAKKKKNPVTGIVTTKAVRDKARDRAEFLAQYQDDNKRISAVKAFQDDFRRAGRIT